MNRIVAVRGGGDIATGTIHRLFCSGLRVVILECGQPTAIRRKVSFCEAVYEDMAVVEGICCRRVSSPKECEVVWEKGEIPLLVDEQGVSLSYMRPSVVVDAILAKKNLGTEKSMAELTIGLGPGFYAKRDVDYVIETMRGHDLGRIITEGEAIPNTGVPGVIGGYGKERVIHAPGEGVIENLAQIGELVEDGQIIAKIGDSFVKASLSGVLRGIIRDGLFVKKGLKIADIDPRLQEVRNCFTISDKARCIGGSVLEVICHHYTVR